MHSSAILGPTGKEKALILLWPKTNLPTSNYYFWGRRAPDQSIDAACLYKKYFSTALLRKCMYNDIEHIYVLKAVTLQSQCLHVHSASEPVLWMLSSTMSCNLHM